MDEKEILRELWQSRLPVCFVLSDEDVTRIIRSESPEPLYLMLPRHLYFPCFIDRLQRYFSIYYKDNSSDSPNNVNFNNLWLEYESTPLKWHYPIGVLYDLYTNSLASGDSPRLPWQIIVHLTKFPDNEIVRFPDKESIEGHFMASLKEADALKHRGQIIGDMQKRDHKQLWNSLLQDKFEAFWSINSRLMSFTENLDHFRYIPFRIYVLDRPFIQKLYAPYDTETGKWRTLTDLLQYSLNNEADFDERANEKKILNRNLDDYRAIIHGVEPPLHTPLQWLSEQFSYPDNFLHVALVEKRP